MNNKVNYTLVGFLVLIGLLLMLGFSYWMLKPSKEAENQKYIIYFNESVLGLNLDAPVKYRGIKVGRVSRLRINPRNSAQVEVMVEILKTTPVKSDTVAKLTAQGITGLTYINLSEGKNNTEILKRKNGQKYPIINSAPSFFEHIEKSIGSVSELLVLTLERTNRVLDDKNQKQFALLLQKTASVMNKVDTMLDDKTMYHIQNSAKNMDDITQQLLQQTIPNVNKLVNNSIIWEKKIDTSLASIKQTYLRMGYIMKNMGKSFLHVKNDVSDIKLETIPLLNTTMFEMQQTLIGLDGLINQYERSPRDVLFKEEKPKRGPGEK